MKRYCELKKLKNGEKFRLIDDYDDNGYIYLRGEYDRICHAYRCAYISFSGEENYRFIPSFAIVEFIR